MGDACPTVAGSSCRLRGVRQPTIDIDPSLDLGRGVTEIVGSTNCSPFFGSNEKWLPGSHVSGFEEDDGLEDCRNSKPLSVKAGPSDAAKGRFDDSVETASDASGSRVTVNAGPFSSDAEVLVKRGLHDTPEHLKYVDGAAGDVGSSG